MATEKRLIDLLGVNMNEVDTSDCTDVEDILSAVITYLSEQPTVDAVEVVLFNALKSLVNGEWVDCKLVQEAMGIDFATGLKLFDFSRTAEWNPAPLNGQKITTKFRLKNAVEVVHGRWVEMLVPDGYVQKASRMRKQCSVCGWTNACRYHYCPNCGAKMDGERKDNG